VGQSSKRKQVFGGQMLNFGPDYLKTDELWPTYFDTFKALGKGYKTPKICRPKSKNS